MHLDQAAVTDTKSCHHWLSPPLDLDDDFQRPWISWDKTDQHPLAELVFYYRSQGESRGFGILALSLKLTLTSRSTAGTHHPVTRSKPLRHSV